MTRGGGTLVRVVDGARYVQVLALTGIGTVVVTRAYLGITGYPQIGGGTLHIAHVLWGGALMLAGIMSALLFASGARMYTAMLGGVGLGLFVDEVGKFVTKTNDYFFRPAAGIIYLVFAALLALAAQLRRTRPAEAGERLANAAQIAAAGAVSGLTARQRDTAMRLLGARDDDVAAAVRRLLSALPTRQPTASAHRIVDRPAAIVRSLLDRDRPTRIVLWVFVGSQVILGLVFVVHAMVIVADVHAPSPGTETGAIIASALSRAASMTMVLIGAIRWRGDWRAAYGWFRSAALVGLFITEIFNFTDSPLRAIVELVFQLVVLAIVTYRLRRPTMDTAREHAVRPEPARAAAGTTAGR